MSFGYSVGDFIAVIRLVDQARKRFTRAPDGFQDVLNEVKQLSNVLRNIEDLAPDEEFTDAQRKDLNEISRECSRHFSSLQEYLDKFHVLAPGNGNQARRIWKRITWDQSEINHFREYIQSSLRAYSLFLAGINSSLAAEVHQITHRIELHQTERDTQELLDWIQCTDQRARQSDLARHVQEGTGKWFLDTEEVQRWIDTKGATLLSTGIPGAGKTMMASILIDYMKRRFRPNDHLSSTTTSPSSITNNVGIAFAFCSFQQREQQSVDDILASLLKQLAQQLSSIPDKVRSRLSTHRQNREQLAIANLLRGLETLVAEYSRVFIIIDALDEFLTPVQVRTLLSRLFELQETRDLNIFATSRDIPDIVANFTNSPKLEVRASEDDIRAYLNGHISELPSFVSRDPELQSEILHRISSTVDGMFLLAKLHHDSLKGKITKKAIRSTLERVATGSDAYHQAYDNAMARIRAQLPDHRETAEKVLQLLTYTQRPLSPAELQHALAVEVGQSALDNDNVPDMDLLISVCAGLVKLEQPSQIICFVHETTQQYFLQTRNIWFPSGHRWISDIMVAYLSFDAFDAGRCHSDQKFKVRLAAFPLYTYAAMHWGYHVRVADEMTLQTAAGLRAQIRLLTSPKLGSAALQAMKKPDLDQEYGQTEPQHLNGLHLAAYFGIANTIHALVQEGLDIDAQEGKYGGTPLHFATIAGYEAVVKFLVQEGASVNIRDHLAQTPLAYAAMRGDSAVIQCLIDANADIETRNSHGQTPLSLAAERGSEEIIRILIENGSDVNSQDRFGRKPLDYAVVRDNETVINALVNAGATLSVMTSTIHDAASTGQGQLLRLLLRSGLHVDSRRPDGLTPLLCAAESKHLWLGTKTFNLLLREGADVNARNEAGESALFKTASRGNEKLTALLLENGAEIDSRNKYGRTPLVEAAVNGHADVVALLIGKGADMSSIDDYGHGIQELDAHSNCREAFRLLTRKGATLNLPTTRDKPIRKGILLGLIYENCKYPNHQAHDPYDLLFCAARHASLQGMLSILPLCPGLDTPNEAGDTALLIAASQTNRWDSQDRVSIARLLVQKGANPHSRGEHGHTALLRWAAAAESETKGMIELLLDAGADVNAVCEAGRSSLSYRSQAGDSVAIALFLARGAAVDQRDHSGRTPLSWSVENDDCIPSDTRTGSETLYFEVSTKCARLLLEAGADTEAEDKDGETPLLRACKANNSGGSVKALLESGASADRRDKNGQNALLLLLENWRNIDLPCEDNPHYEFGMAASVSTRTAVVQLLNCSANIECRNPQGKTPLMVAAAKGYKSMVSLFLERGADTAAQDKAGETALSLASSGGHDEVVRVLEQFNRRL